MSKGVVDSSVLLAIMFEEQRPAGLEELADECAISAVNLAEVHAKLVGGGSDAEDAWIVASALVKEIVPFDGEQAKFSGGMILQTRANGLSLGDRACLALGVVRGLPVYTMDRAWKEVVVGAEVRVLR